MYNYGDILRGLSSGGEDVQGNLRQMQAQRDAELERQKALQKQQELEGANIGGGLAGALAGFIPGGPPGAILGGLSGLSTKKTGEGIMDIGAGGVAGLGTGLKLAENQREIAMQPFKQLQATMPSVSAYRQMYDPFPILNAQGQQVTDLSELLPAQLEAIRKKGGRITKVPSNLAPIFGSYFSIGREEPYSMGTNINLWGGNQ